MYIHTYLYISLSIYIYMYMYLYENPGWEVFGVSVAAPAL